MSLVIRRDHEIYEANGGWFQARWHFSFDLYRDPAQRGVGALRVFNDDRIVPGGEWPMHPHRDIDSLTYVLEGRFEHADTLGNDGTLEPGAAQVMSFSRAGDQHSERNASREQPLRFLQFWIMPSFGTDTSSVQQRQYTVDDRTDRWLQIMSPPGEDGLDLRQDARVWVTRLTPGARLERENARGRSGYAYVIDGSIRLDGIEGAELCAGDAVKLFGPQEFTAEATSRPAELILIETPAEQ